MEISDFLIELFNEEIESIGEPNDNDPHYGARIALRNVLRRFLNGKCMVMNNE